MIAVFAMHSGLKKLKKVYKQVSVYVDLKKKKSKYFSCVIWHIYSLYYKIFSISDLIDIVEWNNRKFYMMYGGSSHGTTSHSANFPI